MNAKPISAGEMNSMVIDSEGSIWVCGSNKSGELGTGDTLSRRRPSKIAGNYTSVSCGNCFTIFLGDLGCAVAGTNEYGQLGMDPSFKKIMSVKILPYLPRIIFISAGYKHSVIIDEFGIAWSSGSNEYGQLGLGDNIQRFKFERIENFPEFTLVTCGVKFSVFHDIEDNIWITGHDITENNAIKYINSPILLPLSNIKDISSNSKSCICLDNKGIVWGLNWGNHVLQNLSQVLNLPEIIAISYGESYCIGLDFEKNLWQFNGDSKILSSHLKFSIISSGGYHFIVADEQGKIYGYGNNASHQLGIYKSDEIAPLALVPSIAIFDNIHRNIKSARK